MRIQSTGILAAVATLAAAGTLGATSTEAPVQSAGCVPTWKLEYSPQPLGEYPGQQDITVDTARPPVLTSVSALDSSDIRFAGSQETMSGRFFTALDKDPVTLRWNGRTLTEPPADISAVPKAESDRTYVDGTKSLSLSSPAEGWQILAENVSLQNATYLQRWHDGRWTMVHGAISPDPTVKGTYLRDVISLSATDAWAVGMLYEAIPNVPIGTQPAGTLIEHWDGERWTIVPSPHDASDESFFDAVTAVSATEVWAVGRQLDSEGNVVPLIAHYDGTGWTEVPAPAGLKPSALYGVDASGPDDVWAVGTQTKPGTTNVAVPLVMHWDGASWSVMEVPDVGNSGSRAVYASSANDVWVIGDFPRGTPTMSLHWDGAGWESVEMPGGNGVNLDNNYADIDGTGPDDVWAVGVHVQPGSAAPYDTLIAHLSCHRGRS